MGVPAMRDRHGTTETPPERAVKTLTLKSSWPEVQPQSGSNVTDLLAFFLFHVSCINGEGESRNVWISCGLVICNRVWFMLSSSTENANVHATYWEARAPGMIEVQDLVLRLVLSQDGQGKKLGTAFCQGRFSQR